MGRLTKRDRQGNWCIKGLPWKDIHIGQVITENTHKKIYGAFCKLLDYEEIGLTPEKVQLLKERDIAKKPLEEKDTYTPKLGEFRTGKCPNCGAEVVDKFNLCFECRQRLDWKEIEK